MAESNEILSLRIAQMNQILDQYRMNLYNLDLKMNLTIKMMEEKGIFSEKEFERRWPLYLKNDVGVIGPDGVMEGSCRIKFYGIK